MQICIRTLLKQGRIHDQQMRLPLGRGSIGSCSHFSGLSQHSDHLNHILTIFTNMVRTDTPSYIDAKYLNTKTDNFYQRMIFYCTWFRHFAYIRPRMSISCLSVVPSVGMSIASFQKQRKSLSMKYELQIYMPSINLCTQ